MIQLVRDYETAILEKIMYYEQQKSKSFIAHSVKGNYNQALDVIQSLRKRNMKTDVDIFNCVRYLLSHAGVRKKTHVIRYLGDISYRKLKVEKEPQKHFCPYCKLPLTIFFIKDSPKSLKPPINHVGLWEPSCFFPYYPNEDSQKEEGVPFYELKKDTKDNSD